MSSTSGSEPSTADAIDDSTQTEGLRERKKRERSQALRTAAIELTLENGFSNVTIEDICTRCGVSRRTFFNYYPSKEEALLGRANTIFDDEDQPAIAEFEAGGPSGSLISDLTHLLTFVVRTRLNKREEIHRYHRILKREPELMQAQMSRMGNSERLFREMIQRRLDGTPAATSATIRDSVVASAGGETPGAPSVSDGHKGSDCHADDGEPVSTRAEALSALAMMAIRATFMRLRRVDGDPGLVIGELFDELRTIFQEDSK